MMLPFGPLDDTALMVSIDMQRLFLEPGPWFGAAGLAILPTVKRLATHDPHRCLHTRFITPDKPDQARGRWAHYYRHWEEVTVDRIGADKLDLHPDLKAVARPDRVFDKVAHDSFDSPDFTGFIAERQPSTLVLFGIETDVCVLATALTAIDRGLRTLIVTDAVASSDMASHQACLDLVFPRFDQQIELVSSDAVIAAWR